MKKIESAELKRLGASAAAMWLYNNTDPMDICRNEDGTITANIAGDARTVRTEADAIELLEDAALSFAACDQNEDSKPYGVFRDPYELRAGESCYDFLEGNQCLEYAFRTREEARAAAKRLAAKEEPYYYKTNNGWRSYRPDSIDSVIGVRVNGWTVGINHNCEDAPEDADDPESFVRFYGFDEYLKWEESNA